MKGQYMAVESVTTIVLGIILAIGSITAFSSYKEQVMDNARQQQARAVESKIVSSIYSLRYAETASKSVDLPPTLGGQDYTVALGEKVMVLTPDKKYSSRIGIPGYEFSGTASGGDVKIFKNGDKFVLRAN